MMFNSQFWPNCRVIIGFTPRDQGIALTSYVKVKTLTVVKSGVP